ncbi:MAG: HAMP domain-containing histidine kinase [Elusimicrobia bacterium]|nr:HAMP domain-containing histidine kinase [Elusimicrobiota bacterium]
MSIRAKYSTITASIVCGVMLCTVFLVSRSQRGVLKEDAQRRLEGTLNSVLRVAQESIAASDELMLYGFVEALRRDRPEISSVTVIRGARAPRVIGEESAGRRVITRRLDASAGSPEEIMVRFGIADREIEGEIARAFRPMLAQTMAIGLVFMALGICAALYVGKLLGEPLRLLAKAAGAVSQGDMDAKVPEGGRDELGALARQFNRMTASLNDLMRLREDLLHTLTHELNTPLAGLKGYLELWQDGKLDGEPTRQKEALETMAAAVSRMESCLAGALLLFRAQERGRHPERNKLVWVNEVVNEVIALFSGVAQSKGVALEALGEGEIGCVYTEEDLLRQAATNVLSNAVKYTPEGGRVLAGLKTTDAELTLWISDTGPGIPPESMKDIFSKFDRSGAGTKSREFGTGLGLSIAKKAVEAMGGRIWVESEAGKGSTFYISIMKQPQAKTAEVA